MLQFDKFEKRFDGNLIVAAADLQLQSGAYWIKGGNGAGKTTLLKCIAGLIPFSGSIKVDNADIRKQRMSYRKIVNYAEAEPLYPDFLTGDDLLRFYAATKNAPPQQAEELTAAFDMEHYIGKKTGTYSSGMAKKLSLALGFIGSPKLVLLDEPLITLDTDALAALQGLITKYMAMDVSFLITSHQPVALQGNLLTQLAITDKKLSLT